MRNILLRSNRRILRAFAESDVLLGFDFDGTLAPIVPDPERATMRKTTSRLFRELSRRYPCVVISGRSRADVLKRLPENSPVAVFGNHGAETGESSDRLPGEVDRWRPILEQRLASIRGVRIEDKAFSISIHYRQSKEKEKARAAILGAIRALGDVRVIGGLQVVNILPKDAPHKGIAFRMACRRLGCRSAIYVGDDDTDEHVFSLDEPAHFLGIRVGAKTRSAACWFLPDQVNADELLRILIDSRGGSSRTSAIAPSRATSPRREASLSGARAPSSGKR